MSLVRFVDDHPKAGVSKGVQHRSCVVCGSVIHSDNFEVVVAAFLAENATQAVRQVPCIVVARHNKGHKGGRLFSACHVMDHVNVFLLITRAGTPTAVMSSGKSSITTAPAP